MSTEIQATEEAPSPRWRPLPAIERRVLGVLIEKAKTTPENYPLSLNSLRAGCNQKSNRAPLMQLEEDHVDAALESLRQAGAVAQIQGGGRVDKYRHLAYDWLGVEKVELAVMAELLLRGAQTVGELRGRAARMEPIKDLADLQPTLDSLLAKGLIAYLTPPGRGSVISHALFLDREMEKVRREAGGEVAAATGHTPTRHDMSSVTTQRGPLPAAGEAPGGLNLAQEVQQLREELAGAKREFLAAHAEFESTVQELRRELDELHRQLGN